MRPSRCQVLLFVLGELQLLTCLVTSNVTSEVEQLNTSRPNSNEELRPAQHPKIGLAVQFLYAPAQSGIYGKTWNTWIQYAMLHRNLKDAWERGNIVAQAGVIANTLKDCVINVGAESKTWDEWSVAVSESTSVQEENVKHPRVPYGAAVVTSLLLSLPDALLVVAERGPQVLRSIEHNDETMVSEPGGGGEACRATTRQVDIFMKTLRRLDTVLVVFASKEVEQEWRAFLKAVPKAVVYKMDLSDVASGFQSIDAFYKLNACLWHSKRTMRIAPVVELVSSDITVEPTLEVLFVFPKFVSAGQTDIVEEWKELIMANPSLYYAASNINIKPRLAILGEDATEDCCKLQPVSPTSYGDYGAWLNTIVIPTTEEGDPGKINIVRGLAVALSKVNFSATPGVVILLGTISPLKRALPQKLVSEHMIMRTPFKSCLSATPDSLLLAQIVKAANARLMVFAPENVAGDWSKYIETMSGDVALAVLDNNGVTTAERVKGALRGILQLYIGRQLESTGDSVNSRLLGSLPNAVKTVKDIKGQVWNFSKRRLNCKALPTFDRSQLYGITIIVPESIRNIYLKPLSSWFTHIFMNQRFVTAFHQQSLNLQIIRVGDARKKCYVEDGPKTIVRTLPKWISAVNKVYIASGHRFLKSYPSSIGVAASRFQNNFFIKTILLITEVVPYLFPTNASFHTMKTENASCSDKPPNGKTLGTILHDRSVFLIVFAIEEVAREWQEFLNEMDNSVVYSLKSNNIYSGTRIIDRALDNYLCFREFVKQAQSKSTDEKANKYENVTRDGLVGVFNSTVKIEPPVPISSLTVTKRRYPHASSAIGTSVDKETTSRTEIKKNETMTSLQLQDAVKAISTRGSWLTAAPILHDKNPTVLPKPWISNTVTLDNHSTKPRISLTKPHDKAGFSIQYTSTVREVGKGIMISTYDVSPAGVTYQSKTSKSYVVGASAGAVGLLAIGGAAYYRRRTRLGQSHTTETEVFLCGTPRPMPLNYEQRDGIADTEDHTFL